MHRTFSVHVYVHGERCFRFLSLRPDGRRWVSLRSCVLCTDTCASTRTTATDSVHIHIHAWLHRALAAASMVERRRAPGGTRRPAGRNVKQVKQAKNRDEAAAGNQPRAAYTLHILTRTYTSTPSCYTYDVRRTYTRCTNTYTSMYSVQYYLPNDALCRPLPQRPVAPSKSPAANHRRRTPCPFPL